LPENDPAPHVEPDGPDPGKHIEKGYPKPDGPDVGKQEERGSEQGGEQFDKGGREQSD
jgi:hypothetical protein